MNKIFLSLLGGGIIIAIIVAAFLLSQDDTKKISTESDDLRIEQTEEIEEFEDTVSFDGSGNFKDLLSFGKNITCDISYVFDAQGNEYTDGDYGGSLEGTVYISGGNLRADLLMITNGGFMESSIIHTDSKGYTWGATPVGEIAITFDVEESMTTNTPETNELLGMDENVTYDCRSWQVDPAKFTPPSDINFVDFSAGIESQLQLGGAAAQCSACEQIPDEAAKAQCLSALQCN